VQRTDDFIAVRNGKIIFVCNRAARAVMAAYWYGQMGFPDVSVLQGGIQAWTESGRALERGADQKKPLGYEAAKKSARLRQPAEIQQVTLDSSVTILDVGGSIDYRGGHLPGAHWISRGWLELQLPNHLPEKDSQVLVTCPDGGQSAFAGRALVELGYSNVFVLAGGVTAWRGVGFETETGMTSCWSEPNDVVISPSITGDKEAMRRYLDWEIELKS
jgi:rhodanese-related sulfurtransferase